MITQAHKTGSVRLYTHFLYKHKLPITDFPSNHHDHMKPYQCTDKIFPKSTVMSRWANQCLFRLVSQMFHIEENNEGSCYCNSGSIEYRLNVFPTATSEHHAHKELPNKRDRRRYKARKKQGRGDDVETQEHKFKSRDFVLKNKFETFI